ncbi:MAG TPA: transglycosylase family protein [Acidimicrobiales bacterium]|jgi:hypothetical protein|nr:transglycosylase family protein [Acidimicrobiales bacterium]
MPRLRSVLVSVLVTTLSLPVLSASPVAADTSPAQGQVDALAAQVTIQAGVIRQLTEQLDQARLRVSTTSSRLASVTRQHEATVQNLAANRSVLLQQAVRAYMHGGVASQTESMSTSADVTLGQEYLQVASGDLTQTGDQLHQLELSLRGDEQQLQAAQQASASATGQLQALRTRALATAADEQVRLVGLQAQLDAKTKAAAAVSVGVGNTASPGSAAATATTGTGVAAVASPTKPTAQGLPVNNGLISVVQQAAGLPVATPVVKPSPPPAPTVTGGGGNAGGVWLQLRTCESSDNYAENTGNGFYGAYQFSASTWTGLGYPGRPDQEPPAMQDAAAQKLQAIAGWGQWPACSAALGLR